MSAERKLLCMFCGDPNTHVIRAWSLAGSDHGEREGRPVNGELYGIPVGGVSGNRRGALVIEIHGECGHVFEIRYQQHKGETYITEEITADRPYGIEEPS